MALVTSDPGENQELAHFPEGIRSPLGDSEQLDRSSAVELIKLDQISKILYARP